MSSQPGENDGQQPSTSSIDASTAHALALMSAFRVAYQERRYTDVTVRCDSLAVRSAHRVVLAAFSTNFEHLLRDVLHVAVDLQLDSAVTGVSHNQLGAVLDRMYGMGTYPPASSTVLDRLRCAPEIFGGGEHALYFRAALARFYADAQHVDCTLTFRSGHSIGAHRLVLSVFGSVFGDELRRLADSQPPAFRQLVVVDVNSLCDHVTHEDMLIVLDYVYTGRVRALRRRFASLRDVARRLGFDALVGTMDSMVTPTIPVNVPPPNADQPNTVPFDENGVEVDDELDYSMIHSAYIDGPERGRKLFSEKPSSRLVHAANDEPPDGATWDNDVTGAGRQEFDARERPFKCLYCSHSSRERAALEKHVRCRHTDETPFRCEYCPQAFKVQSNLVRHRRIHTGEKPYACKECGRSYADKKNMDAHVYRVHLRQRPHVCAHDGCGAKFWRRERLEVHTNRTHGTNADEARSVPVER